MDCHASGYTFLYQKIKLFAAFFIISVLLKAFSSLPFRKFRLPKNLDTTPNVDFRPTLKSADVLCGDWWWLRWAVAVS